MKIELSFEQTRILGVFLEKETTTPDQYPLSINSITTACNQKSNRDPVVEFSEVDVQNEIDKLVGLKLIKQDTYQTGRVAKYRHRFCGAEFSAFKLSDKTRAILCVLFLRGPQTPGELRTRTQRLHAFNDVTEVEKELNELAAREDGPYVCKLDREPGKRESRYAHLFSGDVESNNVAPIVSIPLQSMVSGEQNDSRINELEQEVASLKQEIKMIKEALDL